MLTDSLYVSTKELRYLLAIKPNGILVKFHLEPDTLIGLVEHYLRVCGLYLAIAVGTHGCVRFYVLRCLLSAELRRN